MLRLPRFLLQRRFESRINVRWFSSGKKEDVEEVPRVEESPDVPPNSMNLREQLRDLTETLTEKIQKDAERTRQLEQKDDVSRQVVAMDIVTPYDVEQILVQQAALDKVPMLAHGLERVLFK